MINLSAKFLLQGLLSGEQLANCPFLILGNKIDLPHAASEEELRHALAIDTTGKVIRITSPYALRFVHDSHNPVVLQGGKTTDGIRPIEIYMCSVLNKFGYGAGEMFCVTKLCRICLRNS